MVLSFKDSPRKPLRRRPKACWRRNMRKVRSLHSKRSGVTAMRAENALFRVVQLYFTPEIELF